MSQLNFEITFVGTEGMLKPPIVEGHSWILSLGLQVPVECLAEVTEWVQMLRQPFPIYAATFIVQIVRFDDLVVLLPQKVLVISGAILSQIFKMLDQFFWSGKFIDMNVRLGWSNSFHFSGKQSRPIVMTWSFIFVISAPVLQLDSFTLTVISTSSS